MRLIDADKLIEEAAFLEGIPLQRIKNEPTIDAEPVKHGKWLTDTQEVDSCIKCSVCGVELDKYIIGGDMPEYCLCGAKMDLE